jgi:hypothetical protein
MLPVVKRQVNQRIPKKICADTENAMKSAPKARAGRWREKLRSECDVTKLLHRQWRRWEDGYFILSASIQI